MLIWCAGWKGEDKYQYSIFTLFCFSLLLNLAFSYLNLQCENFWSWEKVAVMNQICLSLINCYFPSRKKKNKLDRIGYQNHKPGWCHMAIIAKLHWLSPLRLSVSTMLTRNAEQLLLRLRGDRVVSVRFKSLISRWVHQKYILFCYNFGLSLNYWMISLDSTHIINKIFIKLSLTSILKSACEFRVEVFKLFLFCFSCI